MTRETVEFWLDKQIEISEIAKEYQNLYDDNGAHEISRGLMMNDNELFVHCYDWWEGGANFFYNIAELVAKTIVFNPNQYENSIEVSFMYKGYKVYTMIQKKGDN